MEHHRLCVRCLHLISAAGSSLLLTWHPPTGGTRTYQADHLDQLNRVRRLLEEYHGYDEAGFEVTDPSGHLVGLVADTTWMGTALCAVHVG